MSNKLLTYLLTRRPTKVSVCYKQWELMPIVLD